MDLAFKSFAKINPQSDYEGLVFTLSKEYSNKDAGYATGFSYNWTQKPEDTRIRVIWMGAAPFNWNDPYAPPWKVLAHEVGHNFGLADLYAVPNNSEMIDSFKGDTSGPWDLMGTLSSPGNEMSFWSRWLLGWLKDSQVNCITDASSASTTSLSPIGINDAQAKGIVIPLSRYTALLIESRRSVGYDSRLLADETGFLVYKLDTRISSGTGPIKISVKDNVDMNCEILFINRVPTGGLTATWKSLLKFIKLVKRNNPDFVLLNCDLPEFFGLFLKRSYNLMVIEHSKYTKLDHMIHFSFKKSYGGSIFSFFEIIGNADEEVKVDLEATEED